MANLSSTLMTGYLVYHHVSICDSEKRSDSVWNIEISHYSTVLVTMILAASCQYGYAALFHIGR